MSALRRASIGFACLFACAAPVTAQDLSLQIANGKVTLIASNVPARQILAEWTRVGKTQVVNAEKAPLTPLTLTLQDVPEAQALDIVLRGASGYMAAPRLDASAGSSVFDRILIMPPSTVVVSASAPRPVNQPAAPPTFTRPPGFPTGDAPDDDGAVLRPNTSVMPMSPVSPGMPGYVAPPPVAPPGTIPPYPGAPMNYTTGQVQPQQPQGPTQNPFVPTPPGSTLPGVIAPQPGVPQMPGVINPLAPRRPGGGQ